MPTHDEASRFLRDWATLTPDQRALFKVAMREMVDDLKAKRPFRARLRVKAFHALPGACEMSWAGDGRALFTYGTSPHPDDVHISWLRVGTHDIFKNP